MANKKKTTILMELLESNKKPHATIIPLHMIPLHNNNNDVCMNKEFEAVVSI